MMQQRNVLAVALLSLAYLFLVPGLTLTLFTAKAEAFGFTVLDLEKSTVGTIRLLLESRSYFPALTILLLSVLMPVVKLGLLIVLAVGSRPANPHLLGFVQRVSKWATIDVFAAAIMVGFFSAQSALQVNLHEGFYCFLAYCVLSTAGTLLIDQVEPQLDGKHHSLTREPLPHSATAASFVAGAIILAYLLTSPAVLRLEHSALLREVQLSVVQLIHQLWATDSKAAALTLSLFVVGLPLAHLAMAATALTGRRPAMPGLRQWIQDFAMLDVFALALVVVACAASGVNGSLKMTMLPTGWGFCAFGAVLLADRWAPQSIEAAASKAAERERFAV